MKKKNKKLKAYQGYISLHYGTCTYIIILRIFIITLIWFIIILSMILKEMRELI